LSKFLNKQEWLCTVKHQASWGDGPTPILKVAVTARFQAIKSNIFIFSPKN
jgi:hypothetical protein